MTPLEMIAEWRKGCSCAPPEHPEECHECTRVLIEALERSLSGEHIVAMGMLTLNDRGAESHQRIVITDNGEDILAAGSDGWGAGFAGGGDWVG